MSPEETYRLSERVFRVQERTLWQWLLRRPAKMEQLIQTKSGLQRIEPQEYRLSADHRLFMRLVFYMVVADLVILFLLSSVGVHL